MRDQPSLVDDLQDMAQQLDDLREKAMVADADDAVIQKLMDAAVAAWDAFDLAGGNADD